jgi:hypothetical protein
MEPFSATYVQQQSRGEYYYNLITNTMEVSMRSSIRMRVAATGLALTVVALVAACSKNSGDPASVLGSNASITNGLNTEIPAYYDSSLFRILFMELPHNAEQTVLAKNPGLNNIYQSDPGLPGSKPFISVIDAIPADGMNPLWREIQIAFNPGFTPRQLFSDNEILAAAAGPNPEITLLPTTEVYRCPVIGHKP